MWQFLTGFGIGVYVGTFYDCRPAIRAVRVILKENMPEEKKQEQPEEKPVTIVKSVWPFS